MIYRNELLCWCWFGEREVLIRIVDNDNIEMNSCVGVGLEREVLISSGFMMHNDDALDPHDPQRSRMKIEKFSPDTLGLVASMMMTCMPF